MKSIFLIFLILSPCYLSAQKTEIVADVNPNGNGVNASLYPPIVKVGDQLFFHGFDNGLWRSDGSASGTYKLSHDSIGHPFPINMTNFRDSLYFSGSIPPYGRELVKSDGTIAGTHLLKDIAFGSANSDPQILGECNGYLYFRAFVDGQAELWKTDGSAIGTERVLSITPFSFTIPWEGVCLDTTFFFRADDGSQGAELWKTNGSDTSTRVVKDIHPTGASYPQYLRVLNGKILFYADDGTHGAEPWISDGTLAGTQLLRDIHPSASSIYSLLPQGVDPIAVIDSTAYFAATDLDHRTELWKTDGSPNGTVMVKDIYPGMGAWASSTPLFLTAFQGKVFFNANSPGTGQELWSSDGTELGTQLVKDVQTGGAHGNPNWIKVVNGKLYFSGFNHQYGEELWVSDGSPGGTLMVEDIMPGVTGTSPKHFVSLADTVYFLAFHPVYQLELWKYDPSLSPLAVERPPSPLRVFPNPATRSVQLEFESVLGFPTQIEIIDLQGQVVQKHNLGTSSVHIIPLDHLGSGLYFIRNSEKAWYQALIIMNDDF